MKKKIGVCAGLFLVVGVIFTPNFISKLYADVVNPSMGMTSSGPYHHLLLPDATPVIQPGNQPENEPVTHKKKTVKKHKPTAKKMATPQAPVTITR